MQIVILLILYLVSVNYAKNELLKTEEKVITRLNNDGFKVNTNKVKRYFNIISLIPLFNIYEESLMKDNFDSCYIHIKKKFLRNKTITETSLLKKLNKNLNQLSEHEKEFANNLDLTTKAKFLETKLGISVKTEKEKGNKIDDYMKNIRSLIEDTTKEARKI